MAKLAVTGHDASKLIDCSEAVPIPKPPVGKATTFPAGTGPKLVQQSCPKPFPVLKTDRKSSQSFSACLDANNISLNSWGSHYHPRVHQR